MPHDVICLGEVMVELSLNDAPPDTPGPRFPADTQPIRAIRAAGSRDGVRVELLTAAGTPTALTSSTDSLRKAAIERSARPSWNAPITARPIRPPAIAYSTVVRPSSSRKKADNLLMKEDMWRILRLLTVVYR